MVVSENIIEVSNGFSHQEIGGAPFHTKTMIKTVMMTISKQHDDDHVVMFTTKVAKRGCPKGLRTRVTQRGAIRTKELNKEMVLGKYFTPNP